MTPPTVRHHAQAGDPAREIETANRRSGSYSRVRKRSGVEAMP